MILKVLATDSAGNFNLSFASLGGIQRVAENKLRGTCLSHLLPPLFPLLSYTHTHTEPCFSARKLCLKSISRCRGNLRWAENAIGSSSGHLPVYVLEIRERLFRT